MCPIFFFFFLSLNLLIGWQLSIWICCRPFSSLLYNYQLLCFWRLALSTVVEVVPRPFFPDIAPSRMFTTSSLCLCALSMSGVYFLKFLKVIFLISPFEKLHHSLFNLPILLLTFFSNTMFQMRLWPSLHFFLRSTFLIRKEQHSKYNSYKFLFHFQTKVTQT